jgi:hypothetical protein
MPSGWDNHPGYGGPKPSGWTFVVLGAVLAAVAVAFVVVAASAYRALKIGYARV